MELCNLPAFLGAVPAANVADPDGEIERTVHALMEVGDRAGAFRLSCTIRNHYRREAWYRRLRREAIRALQVTGGVAVTKPDEVDQGLFMLWDAIEAERTRRGPRSAARLVLAALDAVRQALGEAAPAASTGAAGRAGAEPTSAPPA
jgi:hypothetical protein